MTLAVHQPIEGLAGAHDLVGQGGIGVEVAADVDQPALALGEIPHHLLFGRGQAGGQVLPGRVTTEGHPLTARFYR